MSSAQGEIKRDEIVVGTQRYRYNIPLRTGKALFTDAPPIVVRGRAYTRMEIAAGTGLHLSTISKYFTCNRPASRFPSLRTAIRIAAFLGISVEELTKLMPHLERIP